MGAGTIRAGCRRCGDLLPAEARFCPRCGEPAASHGMPPTVELPPHVHRAERRPFGLPPVPLLGALAPVLLIAGVVLLALGDWAAGIVFLFLAAGVAALFASGLRQEPESDTARFVRRVTARGRASLGFVGAACLTWTSAVAQLIGLRLRRLRLRRELRSRLAPLGEAVHREEVAQAEALKAKAAGLQRALEAAQRRESDVLSAARAKIQRERAPVQPTEVLRLNGEGFDGEAERAADATRPLDQSLR